MSSRRSVEKELVGCWMQKSLVRELDRFAENSRQSRSDYLRAATEEKIDRDRNRSTPRLAEAPQTGRLPESESILQERDFFVSLPTMNRFLKSEGYEIMIKDCRRRIVSHSRDAGTVLHGTEVSLVGRLEEDVVKMHPLTPKGVEKDIITQENGYSTSQSFYMSDTNSLEFVKVFRLALTDSAGRFSGIGVVFKKLCRAEIEVFLTSLSASLGSGVKADSGTYCVHVKDGSIRTVFDDMAAKMLGITGNQRRNKAKWHKIKRALAPSQELGNQTAPKRFNSSRTIEMPDDWPVYSEDKRAVLKFLFGLYASKNDGEVRRERFRLWTGDNENRWFEASGFVKLQEDGSSYVFVSHRLESEGGLSRFVAPVFFDNHAFPGRVFVKDEDRRFVYMNQRMLAEFGRPLRQICGRTDRELGLSPEECRFFRKMDDEVLKPNALSWYLVPSEKLTLPNKAPLTLITIKLAIPATVFDRGARDDLRYILGISFEATPEWQRIERSAAFWQAFLDRAEDVWYVKNQKLEYECVSRSFCKLAGLADPSSAIGKRAAEVWRTNQELVTDMEFADRITFDKGRFSDDQPKATCLPDGSIQQRVTSKVRIEDLGRTPFLLGLSRDVTSILLKMHDAQSCSK